MVYGGAELIHAYGFLSVFVAALTMRARERDHEYHSVLHQFSENVERLLAALLLVLFGGALVAGILEPLTWVDWAVIAAVVLVVRPVSGLIALIGSGTNRYEAWAIAFFGVRGMGSVYYLAYAMGKAPFADAERLWALAAGTLLVSLVLHGFTATPVMAALDRRRKVRHRMRRLRRERTPPVIDRVDHPPVTPGSVLPGPPVDEARGQQ